MTEKLSKLRQRYQHWCQDEKYRRRVVPEVAATYIAALERRLEEAEQKLDQIYRSEVIWCEVCGDYFDADASDHDHNYANLRAENDELRESKRVLGLYEMLYDDPDQPEIVREFARLRAENERLEKENRLLSAVTENAVEPDYTQFCPFCVRDEVEAKHFVGDSGRLGEQETWAYYCHACKKSWGDDEPAVELIFELRLLMWKLRSRLAETEPVSGLEIDYAEMIRFEHGEFRPIDQTKEHGDQNDNCFRACLASVTEVHIDDIPPLEDHMVGGSDDTWWYAARGWGRDNCFDITHRNDDPGILCIASGPTERGSNHSVVWFKGQIVHDPHPSRAGIKKPHLFTVVLPLIDNTPPEEAK